MFSSRGIVSAAASGAPAWFAALADKEVKAVAGASGKRIVDAYNALSPRPTNSGGDPPGVMAYGGAVMNPLTKEMYIYGGGHGEYPGNEVYGLDLTPDNASNITWTMLIPPSPGAFAPNNFDLWNAGSQYDADIGINQYPASTHTYNLVTCDDLGRMWLTSMAALEGAGTDDSTYYNFSKASGWQKFSQIWSGTRSSPGGWYAKEGAAVFDKTTGKVWCGYAGDGGTGVGHFSIDTRNSDAVTTYNTFGWGNCWAACAHDLGVVVFGSTNYGGGAPTLFRMPVSSPTTFTSCSTSGTLLTGTYYGAVYHQPSRSILIWNGGGQDVIKLKIPNPLTGTWTFSTITGFTGDTPTDPINGGGGPNPTGSRFNIIEDMGNGHAALIVINRPSEAAYVWRLPTGELT